MSGFLYYSGSHFYAWDSSYLLVIVGLVIAMIASAQVKSTFAKYNKVRTMQGLTGEQAAAVILQRAGIYGVTIERISGNMTDHFDPKSRVLRLSDTVYGVASVAAVGVAAHECGHAIQDNEEYAPIKIRGAIVPVVNIGSHLSWPIIIAGLIFSFQPLITIGIILFAAVVAFQLITLPVEFDASKRALKILGESQMLVGEEMKGAKRVLSAAAMTYVAAALASILQLARLLLLSNRRKN